MKHNQLGRFNIDALFMMQNLDVVAEMMNGMVVKSVNIANSSDSVEYMAISSDFDEVEVGGDVPEYDSIITVEMVKDGEFSGREKVTSRKWVKR